MGVAVGAAPEEAAEAARRGLLAQRDQEAPPLQGAHLQLKVAGVLLLNPSLS